MEFSRQENWSGLSFPSPGYLSDSGTLSPASREKGFTGGPDGQESACNAGEPGSIPGLRRSPGGGHGNPLQYPCLENSMDCIIHGVSNSWTGLNDFHFHIFIEHFLYAQMRRH